MPQMFPLYWVPLFYFSILIMLFFIIKNFFFYKRIPNIFISKKLVSKKINLKW